MSYVAGYFGTEVIEVWGNEGRELASVPQISVSGLADRLRSDDVTVIDVRGHSEWESGHLPNAINYLPERLDEISRSRPVVVHCQSCARSAIAASVLRAKGFTNVVNLTGGFVGWEAAGKLVERTRRMGVLNTEVTTVRNAGDTPGSETTILLYSISSSGEEMGEIALTPELMTLIAERFRVLAEPARLQILNCLRGGEMTVTEIVDETDFGQANVSKHLQLLHSTGFVGRRKEGLFVYYKLADKSVFQLCDIMCGRLETEIKARRKLLAV